MNLVVTAWDDERQMAELSFGYNRRFSDFLKLGIKPPAFREYDPTKQRWRVHLTRLPLALNFARRHFEQVDYRLLPEWVQMQVAAARTGSERVRPGAPASEPQESPYSVLCVLPTAPWEVVRAAYKALVMLHHPDRGGDTETLQRINCAYTELESRREKKLTQQDGVV